MEKKEHELLSKNLKFISEKNKKNIASLFLFKNTFTLFQLVLVILSNFVLNG